MKMPVLEHLLSQHFFLILISLFDDVINLAQTRPRADSSKAKVKVNRQKEFFQN